MFSLPLNLEHPLSFARFIMKQRLIGLEPIKSADFDEEATAAFLKRLRQSNGYLEFGSGGSTLEAARLGLKTLSVEADRFFAEAVRRAIPKGAPVEIMDINLGLTREWSRPVFVSPTRRRLQRWKSYSSAPFDRLEELGWFPDFVLIDGRFRRACALQTAREILRRRLAVTVMIDDYFDPARAHYHSVEGWLGVPQRVGRAAIFEIALGRTIEPSLASINEAVSDYE
jgi:hypothetical protein